MEGFRRACLLLVPASRRGFLGSTALGDLPRRDPPIGTVKKAFLDEGNKMLVDASVNYIPSVVC